MGDVLSDKVFWELTIGLVVALSLVCYLGWKSATGRPLTRFQRALLDSIRKSTSDPGL